MQHEALMHPNRHLPLDGTYNVRDIGGYATADGGSTRWGVFFRADSLHRLSRETQSTFQGHGIKTMIDLRRSNELEVAPNVFANSTELTYHHLSLMVDELPKVVDTPMSLVDMYRVILDERQEQVRTVLSTFAAPTALPGVVHCTAGKDRTGVIVALILGLLGVSHETIIQDYALTSTYLGEAFIEESKQRALKRGYRWEHYEPLLTCPPENMEDTLQHLDRVYGGIEAYVDHIGFTTDQVSRLRTALRA